MSPKNLTDHICDPPPRQPPVQESRHRHFVGGVERGGGVTTGPGGPVGQPETGERVEIGCAGGLGRTGTVLACMAILAGLPRDEAVKWVRAKYDPRAVETVEQQDWVRSFGS